MKVFNTDTNFLSNLTSKQQYQIGDPRIICKILSDSLYSNKIGSIVRELSANAYDAHKDAGIADKPFDVHVPVSGKALFNSEEKYFSIRDYGSGLSEDEMISLYTMYGASNKRDSNNLIGGFGIGSKSPFAYTNQFEVTSFYGGRKRQYLCFIDEDEYPCITKLSDTETDEPSGLMVKVNIYDDKDATEFLYEAVKQYSIYKVCPKLNVSIQSLVPYIDNEYYAVYTNKDNAEKLGNIRSVIGIRSGSDHLDMGSWRSIAYIQMNNNIYPITEEIQSSTEIVNYSEVFKNANIILKANTGDCDVNASRESLANTELTRETYKRLVNKFSETIVDELYNRMKDLTDFEKLNYASENSIILRSTNGYYRYSGRKCISIPYMPKNPTKEQLDFITLLKEGIKFDVHDMEKYLDDRKIKFYHYDNSNTKKIKKSRKNETRRSRKEYIDIYGTGPSNFYFYPSERTIFDFVSSKTYLSTVADYYTGKKVDEDRHYIFFTNEKEEIEHIVNAYGNPEYNVLDIKNNKKTVSTEKKVVKNNIEYFVLPIDRVKLSEMRDYKISHKGGYNTVKLDTFMDEIVEDSVIFVISNNELVEYSREVKSNLKYQRHLYNILYHICKKTKLSMDVILLNESNYKKYMEKNSHKNYVNLGYDYGLEIADKYLKKYGLFFDNMDEVFTLYSNDTKVINSLTKAIPESYFEEHSDNRFFDVLNKVASLNDKYNDNPILLEYQNLCELIDENRFKDRKKVNWFYDYMKENPLLQLIAASGFHYSYYYGNDYKETVIACLDKYLTNQQ